jgi:sporulation protein YlmC with PRC-barrel domain
VASPEGKSTTLRFPRSIPAFLCFSLRPLQFFLSVDSGSHIGPDAGMANAQRFAHSHKETAMSTLDPKGNPSGAGTDIIGSGVGHGPGPEVMAAATLDGDKVITSDGEHVGKISDIMLDVRSGRVAYAVLSEGGFLGMGTTLHAIPWSALTLDTDEKCFRVDITAQQLKDDPGFDKDHWPSMADATWGAQLHAYYGRSPYWAATREVVQGRESAADI